jgi:lipopolysaccharide export system protein LptA
MLGNRGARLILLATFFSAYGVCLAADEKSSGPPAKSQNPFDVSLSSGKGPINIRSGKLEFFYNEKRIIYRDGVVATRDTGTIKSDLLTVTYEEQPVTKTPSAPAGNPAVSDNGNVATSRQRIKEAVAEGSVEITSANGNATCKKAVFNEVKRTVTLSGNAVLRDGDNVVKGEVVTVYLDESKVVVEGSAESRPEMEIIPKQDEKGKKEAKAR